MMIILIVVSVLAGVFFLVKRAYCTGLALFCVAYGWYNLGRFAKTEDMFFIDMMLAADMAAVIFAFLAIFIFDKEKVPKSNLPKTE